MAEPPIDKSPQKVYYSAAPQKEEEDDEELATQPISTDLTFQSENNNNNNNNTKKKIKDEQEAASITSSSANGTAKNDETSTTTTPEEVASSPPSLTKILYVARPEWPALFIALFLMIASEGIGLIIPIVLADAYDVLIDDSLSDVDRMSDIHRILGLVMILHFSGIVGGFIRHAILGIIGERLVARLRNQLYTSILKQEIAFFDEHKSGELVSRLGSDTTLLQTATSQSMPEFFLGVIKIIVSVVLMFWISLKLAAATVGSVMVIFIIAVPFGIMIGKLSKSYQDELGSAQTRSTESLGAMRTVQSFAAEERERIRYENKIGNPDEYSFWYPTGHNNGEGSTNMHKTTYSVGFFKAIWNSAFFSFVFGFGFFVMYAILWYGFVLVNDGEISLGDLTAFQSYIFQIGFGLAGTSGHLSKVMEALGASGRIFYLMDRIPNIPTPPPPASSSSSCESGVGVGDNTFEDDQKDTKSDITTNAKDGGDNIKPPKPNRAGTLLPLQRPDRMEGAVTLRDVSFSYPSRSNVPVLKNFNLEVPPNTTAALVGSSGSGKSTVVALLQRFYDVNSGTIEIDGRDIRSLDLSWLRQHIGYVQQEPTLFGLTVRENICYGVSNREVSQEELELVCQKANAHDFIMKWPNGYETLVGERGVKLSGGQKQRIAIARALLVNPRILLLDEATSSLDAEAEHLVQEAIEKAVVGRTVLIVAHRLSTIQRATQIVVLDTHKIVDIGSHEELLDRCSKYQDLIKRQSLMHRGGSGKLPILDSVDSDEVVKKELQGQ